jgi:branched-chain amino acid transport system substrate-binding protein
MDLALLRFFSILGATWLAAAGTASAAGVGLSAPLSGPSALLGEQMRQGAGAAATGLGVELRAEDDLCTAEGGEAAARKFVEAQVSIVIGYLCTASIEAALPILKSAGIPVIAIGVRTDSLTDRRDKTGWPIYRFGPRADSERNAVASILTRLWRGNLFAIVDDGTIYGRELAETFRLAAEQSGLKPVFVDTFRPQTDNQIALVGRLRKAGATHVFVGGDREDIAIIGRDAQQLGMELTIAGGETLRAAPGEATVAEGTLMIAMPEWAEIADRSAIEAIQAAGGIAEGYALPAYAALQIADAAIKRRATAAAPLVASFTGDPFTTAIGPATFDSKGDLAQSLYRLYRFEGGRFVAMEPP